MRHGYCGRSSFPDTPLATSLVTNLGKLRRNVKTCRGGGMQVGGNDPQSMGGMNVAIYSNQSPNLNSSIKQGYLPIDNSLGEQEREAADGAIFWRQTERPGFPGRVRDGYVRTAAGTRRGQTESGPANALLRLRHAHLVRAFSALAVVPAGAGVVLRTE